MTTTNEFDIFDHPTAMLWLREFSKNNPYGYCFLTSMDIVVLKDTLGFPIRENQGAMVWQTEYMGINLFIYQKNKLTQYKVQYLGEQDKYLLDKRFGTYITGFLNEFVSMIINKSK